MLLCPLILHYCGDKNGENNLSRTLCLIFLGKGLEIVSPAGQYLWADKPPWQKNMFYVSFKWLCKLVYMPNTLNQIGNFNQAAKQ